MDQLDHALTLWRKSRRSGSQGSCVEVAAGERLILARDSKDPSGPVLTFTAATWAAFTAVIKRG